MSVRSRVRSGRWPSKATMLVATAIVAIAPGAAHARDLAQAGFQPPMRLGLPTPFKSQPLTDAASRFPSPNVVRNARVCRSWRVMTDKLGETFTAARLRQGVLPSACPAEAVEAAASHWSWPWDAAGLSGALPPRLAGEHGPWSIRCGTMGRRERCALVQSGEMQVADPTADTGARKVPFTTHFVIDTVGAQERIIWRLYVQDRDDTRSPSIEWNAPRGRVEVAVGNHASSAPFSVCTRAGCMLELDLKSAAEIADALWDGGVLRLRIETPPSPRVGLELGSGARVAPVLVGRIVGQGMRRALPQLSLLRQRELRPRAERAAVTLPPAPSTNSNETITPSPPRTR